MAGDERLRLFVALELPPRVRESLVDWRSQSVRGLTGLRLIAPQHLHVTLCFLGWCQADQVDEIARACMMAVRSAAGPAELELGPASWLPPSRPRVLAVDLADSGGTLRGCQSALSVGLERGGWYRPEKRPFRPHVTVARVSRGIRGAAGELPAPPALRFCARSIVLFRSRLSRSGAQYEALEKFEAA